MRLILMILGIVFIGNFKGFTQDTILVKDKRIVLFENQTWEFLPIEANPKNKVFEDFWETNRANFTVDKNYFEQKYIKIELADSNHPKVYMPHDGIKTSGFGSRWGKSHKGIDLGLQTGQEIVSCFDGVVRIAAHNGGYGNLVIVRHYNGLETYYAHLSKININPGQKISAGETIGLGGSTGHSTGPHLHFEIRYYGIAINPEIIFDFKNAKLKRTSFTIDRDIFFKY